MKAVETQQLFRIHGDGRRRRAARPDDERRGRRSRRRLRPERLGKVDAAPDPRRARRAVGRTRERVRRRPARVARARRARLPLASARLRRPALLARARARAARARARRASARRCSGVARGNGMRARTSCSNASVSPTGATHFRPSSRAASSNGSRSRRARAPAAAAASPTSRPASSTLPTRATALRADRRARARAGRTTLVVSHDPQAATIADRVLHLRDGRVSAESAVDAAARRSSSRAAAGCGCPRILLRRAASPTARKPTSRTAASSSRRSPADAARPSPSARGRERAPGRGRRSRLARRDEGVRLAPRARRRRRLVPRRLPHRRHRPVGLGQDDAAARPRRPGSARRRRGDASLGRIPDDELRRVGDRARRAGRAPDPVPERAGERRARARAARAPTRAERSRRSTPSGSASSRTSPCRDCRRANGSASRSRARSRHARKLLLADEPTARLDEANARTIGSLLRATRRRHGAAVVCATHDPTSSIRRTAAGAGAARVVQFRTSAALFVVLCLLVLGFVSAAAAETQFAPIDFPNTARGAHAALGYQRRRRHRRLVPHECRVHEPATRLPAARRQLHDDRRPERQRRHRGARHQCAGRHRRPLQRTASRPTGSCCTRARTRRSTFPAPPASPPQPGSMRRA